MKGRNTRQLEKHKMRSKLALDCNIFKGVKNASILFCACLFRACLFLCELDWDVGVLTLANCNFLK